MIEAPASPSLKHGRKRPPAPRPAAWNAESARPIEIVAPDRYCTAVLLDYAAPFRPEIVSGPGFVVRLRTPAGAGWVREVLSLVERWLEYVRLPCVKLLYGGRSYLIRASPDLAQLTMAPESSRRPSSQSSLVGRR